MHQPYYRNILTGDCVQPWVRLHGTRSYYDMMKLYEEYSGIMGNINFVPSLLRQLSEYVEGGLSDKFLELTEVPAKDLNPKQKIFILRNFFMANPERMIKPYTRYSKLYGRRGKDLSKIDLEELIRFFSWQDFLDMQVFYNLIWFGYKAREEFPEIDNLLLEKGHNFTEEDKKTVLAVQKKVLKNLLNIIRKAPKNIELSTTPYFHPILPLLIDTDFAKRCNKNVSLPQKFSMPDQAEFQLHHGLTYFNQIVGHRPEGLWPAEGSVCPEMIPMLEKAGVKWIATDEEILKNSDVHGKKESYLYRPHTAEFEGSSVNMVFRDRELSNLLSFTYSGIPTAHAIEDLVQRVKSIANNTEEANPLITILLDGENPWETYEGSGKPFLTGLFDEFSKNNIATTTIGKFINEHPPKQTLKKLHTGSWINANFDIWIGKPQKNAGWDYIRRAVNELSPKLKKVLANVDRSPKELLALESFCAACGSDWFWWFDDDFESAFKADFDKIFRMHLKNTFTMLGRDIPVSLFNPIYKFEDEEHFTAEPPAFVRPVIDGLNTSYFEWANAIRINIGKNYGPMAQTDELFETIYFGFNTEGLYARFDTLRKDITFHLGDGEEVIIYLHDGEAKYKFKLFFDGKKYRMQQVSSPEEGYSNNPINIEWAVRSVFELGLKFKEPGYSAGEELTLIITVARHGLEVRRYSHIDFKVPDDNYEKMMWSV